MFFQRQHGLQCGLHAANNVVGERLLVAADLNHEADELAREMVLRTETQRRRSTDSPDELAVLQQRVRKVLVGPTGGQWAADCVLRALAKRGFYAHRRSAAEFTFVGDWLLFGDKFHHADRPYAHAVALRGDMWLDSEGSSTVLLVDREIPSNFRPWAYFQVDTHMPPPAPTKPDMIDLTSDEE